MAHPKQERTLVVIKPDGVQRTLVGEIICRYERTGLKLAAMKMLVPSPEFVEKHYLIDPNWKQIVGEKAIAAYRKQNKTPPSEDPLEVGQKVINTLKTYMSSGPVIAMVWQGMHAIPIVRKITGGTEPLSSDVGTIRGDFTIDSYEVSDLDARSIRNLIHASGNQHDAEKEITLWFRPDEVMDYRLVQEEILYDVNLDSRPE